MLESQSFVRRLDALILPLEDLIVEWSKGEQMFAKEWYTQSES